MRFIAFVAVLAVLVSLAFLIVRAEPRSTETGVSTIVHRSYLLDPEFYAAAYTNLTPTPFDQKVIAGIAPHHLVAARLLANFYERIAATQQPSIVVVIGPDHLDRSGGRVATTRGSWTTPFGAIPAAQTYADRLVAAGLAVIDERIFAVEHSISVETAFVAHAFPGVPLLGVTVPSRLKNDEADAIGDWLHQHLPDDALLLASADFAHEVTSAEAMRLDAESIDVLKVMDGSRIDEMTVDAKPAIRLLFQYAAARGATDVTVVDNENTATVSNSPELQSVTSYVLAAYF